MAPRRKGTLDLQENIETGKQMPLDARQLVRSKEEMLTEGSFDYGYKGLFTAERTEGKLWMLMDHNNPTSEASWKVIGPYDDSALDARVTALENASPGEQVQANWNETDTTSKAFIQNKPTIPPAYDDSALAARVTALEEAEIPSPSWDEIKDKPMFVPVATSGSYNDLEDKPTIPEAYDDTALAGRVSALEAKTETQADWNETDTDSAAYIANKPTIPEAYDDTALAGRVTAIETALPGKADSSSLATVATSGSYNDLTDQPDIPEAYDDTALSARVTALEGRIDADTQADWNETDTTSPAFIQNKPTIPTPITIDAAMDTSSENPVQNKVVLAAIGDAVDVVDTAVQGLDTRVTAAETALAGKADASSLATVATTGSYNDLTDPPTIPEAYDDTALAARVTALETDKVTVTTAAIPGGGGGEEVTVSVQEAGDQTGEKVLGVRYFTDDQGAISGDPTLIVGNENFSLQRELVSGTNIKTINGQSVLGDGNLILHQGVGDGLELNNMPSYNELQQMLNDNALLYIDGNWLVTGLMLESNDAYVIGEYADKTRSYHFDTNYNLDEPLTYVGTYTDGFSSKPSMAVSASDIQPFGKFNRGTGEEFLLFGLDNGISIHFTDQQGRVQNRNYTITPTYKVDKPEGGDAQLGNVVQVGTLQDVSGEVGIFQFFYRTSALPNNTTKEYTLLPLLENYNIVDFLDGTGVTSNGIFIGNGRTDGTNYVIIQQFSKNRKGVILRTYQDYSSQTALLKIKFLGTKTTA